MARPVIRNEWAAWAIDTLERVARTFLQGFLGAVSIEQLSAVFAGGQVELTLEQQLAIGAAAGVWALLTSWAAKPLGAQGSASFLGPTIVVDEHDRPVELDRVELDDDGTKGNAAATFDRDAVDVDVPLDLQAFRFAHSIAERLDLLEQALAADVRTSTSTADAGAGYAFQRNLPTRGELDLVQAAVIELEQRIDPPAPPTPTRRSRVADALLSIVEGDVDPGDRVRAAAELRELDAL